MPDIKISPSRVPGDNGCKRHVTDSTLRHYVGLCFGEFWDSNGGPRGGGGRWWTRDQLRRRTARRADKVSDVVKCMQCREMYAQKFVASMCLKTR